MGTRAAEAAQAGLPFALSLSKGCPFACPNRLRTALRQAQGRRARVPHHAAAASASPRDTLCLGPGPDPAQARHGDEDREKRPRQRHEDEGEQDTQRKSRGCSAFAGAADQPLFPPCPEWRAIKRVVQQPRFPSAVAPRKGEGRKDQERNRGQDREEDPDHAQRNRGQAQYQPKGAADGPACHA